MSSLHIIHRGRMPRRRRTDEKVVDVRQHPVPQFHPHMLNEYTHAFREPQPRPSPPERQRDATIVPALVMEQEVVTHVRVKVEMMKPRLDIKRKEHVLPLDFQRKSRYRFHLHTSLRPMLALRMEVEHKPPLLIFPLSGPRNESR